MIGRLLVGVGLLVGAMTAWAGSAGSQTADVDRQGYAVSGPSVPGLHEVGRLYVAVVGGQEQARSFVHVDLAPRPPVQSLILAMVEGNDAQGAVRPDAAAILACPLTGPFRAGAQPPDDAPEDDCTVSVPGSRAASGRWTFDLTPLARLWAKGEPNHGLVLRPLATTAATWRVIFAPEQSSAQVEWRPTSAPVRSPGAAPSVPRPKGVTPMPPVLPARSQFTAAAPVAPSPASNEGAALGTSPAARPELVPSSRSSVSAGGEAPPWPLITLVVVPGLAAAAAWWLPVPRAPSRWPLAASAREGGSGG